MRSTNFIHDHLAALITFSIFKVIDNFTQEAIGMKVYFFLPSECEIGEIKQIISWLGKSEVIRCYNEHENICVAIQARAKEWSLKIEYIQPCNPQQNAYVERFKRTVRYEWLIQ